MTNAKAGWFGLSLLVAFFPATAWGQANAFGRQGQFAVSGERLLGLFVHKAEIDTEGTATGGTMGGATETRIRNQEVSATEFVVLGNNDSAGPAGRPRIAFDFFAIDGLSLGGALFYENHSVEDDTTGTDDGGGGGGPQPINRNQVEGDSSVFGIAPRVGYAYMFTPHVGIWPRGGLSYIVVNSEEKTTVTDQPDGSAIATADVETTVKHLSLALDGMLVLSPIEHVAFGIGPFVEIPLTGDVEVDATTTLPAPLPVEQVNAEGDFKITSYGISSSLIVWF